MKKSKLCHDNKIKHARTKKRIKKTDFRIGSFILWPLPNTVEVSACILARFPSPTWMSTTISIWGLTSLPEWDLFVNETST